MSSSKHHDYHLVDPSPWPLIGAVSAFTMFLGLALLFHGKAVNGFVIGKIIFPVGLLSVLSVMYVWWRDVIKEGIKDKAHTSIVQTGLRIGMALFILSEVMFFFGFFWSFFKAALDPVLLFDGNVFDSSIEVVRGIWPPKGIEALDAWDIPFINTLILLLSGTTVTWAHYALIHNDRKNLIIGLILTVLLGITFTSLQAYEYHHATFAFKGGIYPSNFYMATGFHGAHVLIGTIFLTICLIRAMRGQMSPEGHLGFEFAAWYWHFVDVVWLFLFTFVYVWGA